MKKFFFPLSVVLILFSCSFPEYYYHTVKNNSQRTITYSFNGGPIETLAQGESKDYRTKAGDRFTGIDNIYAGSPHGFGISITLTRNSNNYIFEDIEPFDIEITNTLSFPVTLKSDYLNYQGETELTVPEDGGEKTALIYKKNPVFEVSPPGFIITLEQKFEDETVYVVIK